MITTSSHRPVQGELLNGLSIFIMSSLARIRRPGWEAVIEESREGQISLRSQNKIGKKKADLPQTSVT
jgi:hypothetical protein